MVLSTGVILTPVAGEGAVRDWGDPQFIAKSGNAALEVDVAVSGDTVHRVWSRSTQDRSKIFYQRSDDGGATWSERVKLGSSRQLMRRPLLVAQDNAVHLVWTAERSNGPVVKYSRSTDGGVTWTDAVSVADLLADDDDSILVSDGRRVYVFFHKRSRSDGFYVAYAASVDNGKHWSSPLRASKFDEARPAFSVAVNAGVMHLAYLRRSVSLGESHDHPVRYQRSTDGGKTWDKGRRLFTNGDSAPAQFAIAAYRDDVYAVDNKGTAIVARHSGDGGATWSRTAAIGVSGRQQGPYALAADGRWVHLVWNEACMSEDGTVCPQGPDSKIVYQRSGNRSATWTDPVALEYPRPNATTLEHLSIETFRRTADIAYVTRDTEDLPPSVRAYTAVVPTPPTQSGVYDGVSFKYDKNNCVAIYNCSPDPTLTLKYTYRSPSGELTTYTKTWKSGSGKSNGSTRVGDQSDPIFGRKGRDPCYRNVGWTPDTSGTNPKHNATISNSYKVRNFAEYGGSAIWGWVYFIYQGSFSWADGANCGDNDAGIDRTELFIHSEMTTTHGQSTTSEGRNWTSRSPDYDFGSAGCIKVSYSDMVEEGGSADSDSVEWRWTNRTQGNDLTLKVVDGW
ncbi:MAG: hypothetical protein GY720_00980 [bacterium]|nr:hypothetical protein [bacterium]